MVGNSSAPRSRRRWPSTGENHRHKSQENPVCPPDLSLPRPLSFAISALRIMFSRVSQVVRHFSRPLPNYVHKSVATTPAPLSSFAWRPMTMTSSTRAIENSRRKIHTAACLIIGDEVLGGKVRIESIGIGVGGRMKTAIGDMSIADERRPSTPIPHFLRNTASQWAYT